MVNISSQIITDHAIDEMNEDDLLFSDMTNIILTGFIRAKTTDNETQESKYIIYGETLNNYQAEIVCKISRLHQVVIIITVYVL